MDSHGNPGGGHGGGWSFGAAPPTGAVSDWSSWGDVRARVAREPSPISVDLDGGDTASSQLRCGGGGNLEKGANPRREAKARSRNSRWDRRS